MLRRNKSSTQSNAPLKSPYGKMNAALAKRDLPLYGRR
jgi:hypothetical protein